jgi:hypothetical protein
VSPLQSSASKLRNIWMLSEVNATRFDRSMINGRTGPLLMAAEDNAGQEIDFIAKFTNEPHLTVNGLVREAIAAMLAVDLHLPIPEPLLVRLDASFLAAVEQVDSDVGARLKLANPVGFGSTKLPRGFGIWSIERDVPAASLNQAAEIFAFDCLTQNADRGKGSPNAMWNGSDFAIIDHELAFQIQGVLFWKPPWESGSLTSFASGHLFYRSIKGKPWDLQRLSARWSGISDARLVQYDNALPQAWRSAANTIQESLNFVRDVRENIVAAMNEVQRSLQ